MCSMHFCARNWIQRSFGWKYKSCYFKHNLTSDKTRDKQNKKTHVIYKLFCHEPRFTDKFDLYEKYFLYYKSYTKRKFSGQSDSPPPNLPISLITKCDEQKNPSLNFQP